MLWSIRISCLIVCLLSSMMLGCEHDDFAEVPVHPVTGTLKVKGEPAYGAYIVFHPTDDVGMTKGNKPFARVKDDGTFIITTYLSDDGAPVGDFNVSVIWPENPESRGPSPDRLKGRYAKPEESGFQAHIESSTEELPAWDIK